MSRDDAPTLPVAIPDVETSERPLSLSLIVYHRDGGRLVPLHAGQPLVVGRLPPADLQLPDAQLSRTHAQFVRHGDVVWVQDLKSTNGTRVNGKRIERVKLSPDDVVAIGGVQLALHAARPSDPALHDIWGHDRMFAALEDEITRCRAFRRPFSLLMLRAAGKQPLHVSRYYPRLKSCLRQIDRVALHDPYTLLVLLTEQALDAGLALAKNVLKQVAPLSQLHCGIAVYPLAATNADALIAAARAALTAASPKQPIHATAVSKPTLASADDEAWVAISPPMKALYATVSRVADSAVPVLIYGETGVGKEVLAHKLHQASRRALKPLRCLNCGAIPASLLESALFGHEKGAFTGADKQAQGIFEAATGGSVLLDEVGELSPAAQAALLRVLETKRLTRVGGCEEIPVDVRIFAATHRDLEQMCAAGQFRSDLLYRLNTVTLIIPPLRERKDEIVPLAELFLKQANAANARKVRKLSDATKSYLDAYAWPGNVRELRNVIERAVVLAQDGVIRPDDLSDRVRGAGPRRPRPLPRTAGHAPVAETPGSAIDLKEHLRQVEMNVIIESLEAHDWNQTRTAKALGIPLRTLVHKIKTFGLKKRYVAE